MVVFYRGPDVRITHEVFETWVPVHRRYPLDNLTGVCVIEQAADPPALVTSLRNASTGVAGATAVTAALGWVEGWHVFEAPGVALALLALLVASVMVSGACWRVRVVERELVAYYRGTPIGLYQSRDPQAFGQVARGLARALERLDDTR